jgi:DnaK suppressor protein
MDKEKMGYFRNRLITDLGNVTATAERARIVVKESSDNIPNFLQDEVGAAQGSRELENAISVHVHCDTQEAQLQTALSRMNLGQFGVCRDCGLEIDQRRLAAIPSAACCIHCQQSNELKIIVESPVSKMERRLLNRLPAQAS